MRTPQGPIVLMCVIALIFEARPAHADEPNPRRNTDQNYSLYSGFNYITGSQDTTQLSRTDVYVGAGYRPHDLFEFVLSLHVGTTNFKYRVESQEKKFSFYGELQQTREPWVSPGVRMRLLRTEKLSLHLFSSMEVPLSQSKMMEIRTVNITVPQLGETDATKFFNEHVQTSYSWYMFSLGTTARLTLGKFEPRLDLGIRRFFGGVGLNMDAQSKSILRLVGYENALQTSYSLEYFTPVVAAGTDYRISNHFSASASGMAFPTDTGWLFGAGGSLKAHW